jgi:hypothetical protein
MIGVGAVGASCAAGEVDTGDVTPEVDATSGVTDDASTTICLAAAVPFASVSPAAAEDDANELAAELGELDDGPTGFDVPWRVVASLLEASEA